MLKKIISFLMTANISEEDYRIAKDDMYNNNVMMLRVLSSIAAVIFIVCTVLGFTVPNMHSKLDMVDVLAFSIAGILIGIVITKVKIERYAYANKIKKIALQDALTDCYNRKSYSDDTENMTNPNIYRCTLKPMHALTLIASHSLQTEVQLPLVNIFHPTS